MSVISKEVSIAASKNLVWWAWTEADRVTEWFAPVANVEARVGGAFELFFDPANRDHMNTAGCVFTSVEPKQSLGFTWKGPDDFADVMNDENNLTKGTFAFTKKTGKRVSSLNTAGGETTESGTRRNNGMKWRGIKCWEV